MCVYNHAFGVLHMICVLVVARHALLMQFCTIMQNGKLPK